jgi:hypothetical protein
MGLAHNPLGGFITVAVRVRVWVTVTLSSHMVSSLLQPPPPPPPPLPPVSLSLPSISLTAPPLLPSIWSPERRRAFQCPWRFLLQRPVRRRHLPPLPLGARAPPSLAASAVPLPLGAGAPPPLAASPPRRRSAVGPRRRAAWAHCTSGVSLPCGRGTADPPLHGQRAAGTSGLLLRSCAPCRCFHLAARARLRPHRCAAPTVEPPPPAPTPSTTLAAAPGPDGSRSALAFSPPDAALLRSQLLVPGFPHIPLDTTGGDPCVAAPYRLRSTVSRPPSPPPCALLRTILLPFSLPPGRPLRLLASGPRTPPVLLSRSRRLSTPLSASTPRPTAVSLARACRMAPPHPLATAPTPSSPCPPRPQPFALLFMLRRRLAPASGQPSPTSLSRTPLSTPGGAIRSCRPSVGTPSSTTSSQRSLTCQRIGF